MTHIRMQREGKKKIFLWSKIKDGVGTQCFFLSEMLTKFMIRSGEKRKWRSNQSSENEEKRYLNHCFRHLSVLSLRNCGSGRAPLMSNLQSRKWGERECEENHLFGWTEQKRRQLNRLIYMYEILLIWTFLTLTAPIFSRHVRG